MGGAYTIAGATLHELTSAEGRFPLIFIDAGERLKKRILRSLKRIALALRGSRFTKNDDLDALTHTKGAEKVQNPILSDHGLNSDGLGHINSHIHIIDDTNRIRPIHLRRRHGAAEAEVGLGYGRLEVAAHGDGRLRRR